MSAEHEPSVQQTDPWSVESDQKNARLTRELFTIDDSDHEIVRKFHPEFIAKGGGHAVYSISDHPDLVAKVDLHSILSIMNYNSEHGHAADYLPAEKLGEGQDIRTSVEHEIGRDRDRLEDLRSYFGKEHILAQKSYLMKVPVSPAILRTIFRDKPHASLSEAWAIVTMQRKTEVPADPFHFSLTAGYAETHPLDAAIYEWQTKMLFSTPETSGYTEGDFREFLTMQQCSYLSELVAQSDTDKDLSFLLAELTTRAITYTKETGEILDLAGNDNLAVFKKDEAWSYQLIDALYPSASTITSEAASIVRKIRKGKEINLHDRIVLLNVMNYTRTINALAKHFRLPHTIDVLSHGPYGIDTKTKGASIDYLSEIKPAFTSQESTQTTSDNG